MMSTILSEKVRPHPMYGKFKKWAHIREHGPRVELVFDSRNGSYHVHLSGNDTGELFVWVTQSDQTGMQELRRFRNVKKTLAYLKERFGIKLLSLKNALQLHDYSKMPRWMRRQYT